MPEGVRESVVRGWWPAIAQWVRTFPAYRVQIPGAALGELPGCGDERQMGC